MSDDTDDLAGLEDVIHAEPLVPKPVQQGTQASLLGGRWPIRNRTPARELNPRTGQWVSIGKRYGQASTLATLQQYGAIKSLSFFLDDGKWANVSWSIADIRRRNLSRHLSTYTDLPEPPTQKYMPEGYQFPQTLHQAMKCPWRKYWKEALLKEHG